jgi:hypothetical protein
MSKAIEIVVEWQYSPKDFFEENVVISHDHVRLTIGDGRAEARLEPEYFRSTENLIEGITHQLESR